MIRAMNLLKSALFFLLVTGSVTVLVPQLLVHTCSPPSGGSLRWIGVVPILLGVPLLLWCGWDFAVAGKGTPAPFDPPKELVVRGPYRFVRNPMYISVGLILAGEAIVFQSPAILVYLGACFLVSHLFVILYEERVLERKFGDSYRRYRAAVPRWRPRLLGPYQPRA